MARIRVMSPVGEVKQERFSSRPCPRTGRVESSASSTTPSTTSTGWPTVWAPCCAKRHGVRTVVHRRKANAATPAPPELIAELSKECDVVFTGSAD